MSSQLLARPRVIASVIAWLTPVLAVGAWSVYQKYTSRQTYNTALAVAEITDDPDHEGEYVGQVVGRITSQPPTASNACGVLLTGVVDRDVPKNEDVDLDEFIGGLYRITIAPQKDNPERTQVVMVVKVKTGGRPASAPAAAPKPPPRHKPPLTAQAPVKYWIERGEDEPDLLAPHEINAWLSEQKVDPATVEAKLALSPTAACVSGVPDAPLDEVS